MVISGQRRRLLPEERRQQLIEAAERVLREKGLETRVEDVVNEAGAAKGTFYLYFNSWEDLLLEIRSRIFIDFQRRHMASARHALQPDWNAFLAEQSTAFVEYTVDLGKLHDAIFHGQIACSPAAGAGFDAVAIVADMLRAGNEARDFDVADADMTARLVFAVMHETVDAIRDGADREQALEAMRSLLGRALAGNRRATSRDARAMGREMPV